MSLHISTHSSQIKILPGPEISLRTSALVLLQKEQCRVLLGVDEEFLSVIALLINNIGQP